MPLTWIFLQQIIAILWQLHFMLTERWICALRRALVNDGVCRSIMIRICSGQIDGIGLNNADAPRTYCAVPAKVKLLEKVLIVSMSTHEKGKSKPAERLTMSPSVRSR